MKIDFACEPAAEFLSTDSAFHPIDLLAR